VIALYRRFTSLDRSHRPLVLEAASLMVLVWTGLHLLRFPVLRRILDHYAGLSTTPNAGQPHSSVSGEVRWAITRVAARFPSSPTCLVQALAADAMLRRRGLTSELRIGVRVRAGRDRPFEAHAWVECGGAVAIGAIENLSDFKALTASKPQVIGTTPSPAATDLFAGLLRGEPISWSAFRMAPDEFGRACSARDLTSLIYDRLRRLPETGDWPRDIREALAWETRAQAAKELLRRKELISVLGVLAAEGIDPILLKGTALGYSVYDTPASRPRIDTDLLIRPHHVELARRVMFRNGYTAPTYCGGDLLFCQFPLKKTDEFSLVHTFDVHWKISTQSVFADLLAFDEIAADAMSLPALGAHARTAGPLHALLLACIHPVMHHRNVESLVWIYDIHLLASRLTERQFESFSELAVARRVSAICAHQLSTARRWLGTRIPDSAIMKLGAVHAREPSAAYLRPNRHWGDELISNIQGLPRWSDRLRLLREVALPGPTYMLKAYGLAPSSLGTALLPALYLHRLSSGGWKVLAGQK
jgi:hypothetical protein